MSKKLTLFFLIAATLFAFEIQIKNLDSIANIKKELEHTDIRTKIKLEIVAAIEQNRPEDAKLLLELIKPDPNTGQRLENLLLAPKDATAIVVSKKRQKLKVIKNSTTYRISELPCITGKRPGDKFEKGDKKTPNGVYFPLYFIPPQNLSSTYGIGAFPLNYPNIIDKRFFKKTGNGIWLHATDNEERKPFSSNGCVVMKNAVFEKVEKFITPKVTPVVIVDDFSYVPSKEYDKTKVSLGYFVYRWKRTWELSVNGNVDEYTKLYSDHMVWKRGDKKSFIAYKKLVSQGKRWIKITLKNLYLTKDGRVLDYGHIYVASFDMDYKSNNYKWSGKKVLYIIKENGKWKILAEESL